MTRTGGVYEKYECGVSKNMDGKKKGEPIKTSVHMNTYSYVHRRISVDTMEDIGFRV